jgi:hypothetical protein
MRKCTILVLLIGVVPAWAGLGDIGKLKSLVDKKDDKARKEEENKKEASGETGEAKASEPAEPTKPTNKPEDVDKGGNIKTMWHDVKVGQMVKSKMPNDMAMRMEVAEVKDRVVLIKYTTFMKGKPVNKSLTYFAKFSKKTEPKKDQKQPEMKITELPDETLKIDGKKVKCKVRKTEMKMEDGKTITSIIWTNKDVLGQNVKIKNDFTGKMQVMSEVVEFRK